MKPRPAVRALALFVCSLLLPPAAFAQAQRTFVASSGVDTNPCSRSAPCRTFAVAIAATLTGGEVIVIDSAGYGPVSITKGVSIVAPAGVYAGVTAFSGDAIAVSAAGATVRLRGLTINGLGAANGINATNVAALYVDDCVITGFNQSNDAGLAVAPPATTDLFADGVFASDDWFGFEIGAGVNARLTRCRADRGNTGFRFYSAGNSIRASVRDGVATSNLNLGFDVQGNATVQIRDSISSANYTGLQALGGTVTVCTSMISHNNYAFVNAAGTLNTCGNNQITDNTSADVGTITTLSPR